MELISCYDWKDVHFFRFFSLYWKQHSEQHTQQNMVWVNLSQKYSPRPPIFASRTYAYMCEHRVWGTHSLLTVSSLLSPHPLTFISPPTPTGFQPTSPGLLSSLTRQQMDSKEIVWKLVFHRVKRHHTGT